MYSMKDLLILTQYQAYCKVKQVVNMFPKETVRYKDGSYLIMNYDSKKPKPMLCIHLDTINTHRGIDKPLISGYFDYNKELDMYSVNKNSNLSCLGGDDRAGLWVLMRLLADKDVRDYYCYGVFFDEEVGGKGSSKYMMDYKDYEDGVSCFIGLDRRGVDEVATYGNDNEQLLATISNLGYKKAYGTFTDASNLSDDIACCNLSVGYYNEHTPNEVLYMEGAKACLRNLTHIAELNLLPDVYKVEGGYTLDVYDDRWETLDKLPTPVLCDCCGEHLPLYEHDDTGYLLCGDCYGYY